VPQRAYADTTSSNRADDLELAAFIRENLDEIGRAVAERYASIYDYSCNYGMPAKLRESWIATELLCIVQQLETGEVDPHKYRHSRGGNMVIQRERIFAPLAITIETKLFHARVIAPLIWNHYIHEPHRLRALCAALERSVQGSLRANVESFLDEICQPGALESDWDFHPEAALQTAAQPLGALDVADARQAARQAEPLPPSARDALPAARLTDRELQIAKLVIAGKTNGEIAAALKLKQGTVKNHLSRIFNKLNISSRTELAVHAVTHAG